MIDDKTALCTGCSVLDKHKPFHTHLDYEALEELDILFLSESFKFRAGERMAFSEDEHDLIVECLHPMYEHIEKRGLRVDFSAAVKCPNVQDMDMTPSDRELCRAHLNATLDQTKPKLVFTCGNFAMKMLIKKSGLTGRTGKRGKGYEYETPNGHKCHVVPIYHPYAVIQEPRHKYLFEVDIRNGYEKYILERVDQSQFKPILIDSYEALEQYSEFLTTKEPVSVDVESTGLDFTRDTIHTIGLSCQLNGTITNICVPVDHEFSPLSKEDREHCLQWVREVLSNPNNKKIVQNGNFDRKFLKRYGIVFTNTWDTKILSKLINEDSPNDLKNMVKEFFSHELEDL